MSENPFEGLVDLLLPSWAESRSLIESVNIGAKNRKLARWKVKVPKTVQPGKYQFTAQVHGNAFDKRVRVEKIGVIEVRA